MPSFSFLAFCTFCLAFLNTYHSFISVFKQITSSNGINNNVYNEYEFHMHNRGLKHGRSTEKFSWLPPLFAKKSVEFKNKNDDLDEELELYEYIDIDGEDLPDDIDDDDNLEDGSGGPMPGLQQKDRNE